MLISYQITFNIGGTTGNKVAEVQSNIHKIEINGCNSAGITEPTDKSAYTQNVAIGSNNDFIIPDFVGGVSGAPKTYTLSG